MILNRIDVGSRRDFLRGLGMAAGAAAVLNIGTEASAGLLATSDARTGGYTERFVIRNGHRIYVRDYPGNGPPFVMVHGFPDNCRIYESLAPILSAAGRRVIAFDFLGYGSSDKPAGFRYDFAAQLADMKAVADDLGSSAIVPVAHDAGGPAVINFALDQKGRVESLVFLNCYYAPSPVLRFPEFIELCSDPALKSLARAMMTDPKQAAWLLHFQQGRFEAKASAALRARFDAVLQPLINDDFAKSPSSVPAFLGMTGDARANLAANGTRISEMRAFSRPVRLIWGVQDPYLDRAVADDIASHFGNAKLTAVEANHWPQIDAPEIVARAMLDHG